MDTQREKAKVFYLVSPWVGYLVASALIIAAIVITLSCIDKQNWLIAGLAWVFAIPISVIVLLESAKCTFTADGLSIRTGQNAQVFRNLNITIPRSRLIGIGSIAPVLIEQTALYFSDEDGDATYLHLTFTKGKMKQFRRLFQETYPEAHFTDDKKSEMFKELFGEKLKDISIKGKPWKALAIYNFLGFGFGMYFAISLTFLFLNALDITLTQAASFILSEQPFKCLGSVLMILVVVFMGVRELVLLARARDKAFSIYDNGILLISKNKLYLPRTFLKWQDILSFSRARIYPWIVIKYRDDMGRKRVLRIPGHLDDADFSEIQAYVDMHHE